MKTRNAIIPLLFALALTSCTGGKVYDCYQHTPVGGWERNDTLMFADIARFSRSAVYTAELGLRISGATRSWASRSSSINTSTLDIPLRAIPSTARLSTTTETAGA